MCLSFSLFCVFAAERSGQSGHCLQRAGSVWVWGEQELSSAAGAHQERTTQRSTRRLHRGETSWRRSGVIGSGAIRCLIRAELSAVRTCASTIQMKQMLHKDDWIIPNESNWFWLVLCEIILLLLFHSLSHDISYFENTLLTPGECLKVSGLQGWFWTTARDHGGVTVLQAPARLMGPIHLTFTHSQYLWVKLLAADLGHWAAEGGDGAVLVSCWSQCVLVCTAAVQRHSLNTRCTTTVVLLNHTASLTLTRISPGAVNTANSPQTTMKHHPSGDGVIRLLHWFLWRGNKFHVYQSCCGWRGTPRRTWRKTRPEHWRTPYVVADEGFNQLWKDQNSLCLCDSQNKQNLKTLIC